MKRAAGGGRSAVSVTIEVLAAVRHNHQTRLEWALLFVIALVCAVLTFLQYRWTGELSVAEHARLRAGLDDQVHRVVRAFDDEIRENCTILVPEASEIRHYGRDEAHRRRYAQWASSHERSLFSRIGIAAAEGGMLNLYGVESDGRTAAMVWPAGCESLRLLISARRLGRFRRAGGVARHRSCESCGTRMKFPATTVTGKPCRIATR